jgi:hypothetical protein
MPLSLFSGGALSRAVSLPIAGEVFAYEVAPGVEVLLRAVETHGATACLVLTRVEGARRQKPPRVPALFEVEPFARRGLAMTGAWVSEGPPQEVRRLGQVAVRDFERSRVVHPESWVKAQRKSAAQTVLTMASWKRLLDDVRRQWRWTHEREVVLAEEARAETEKLSEFARALEQQRQENERLVERGVASLIKQRFFGAWKGQLPRALINDAERAMHAAVVELEGRTPRQATGRLAKLVREFNRLGSAHEHTFDATESEDIMDAVGTLALACGVDEEAFDERIDAARKF